jgi:hypothetical protein
MHVKLTAFAGSLVGAAAIALTVAMSTPTAQAATLAPATTISAHATIQPDYTAKVTATVRCGKFVGEILHGGNGGIIDPAYLEVHGKLSSSCNSTTYLEVRYETGLRHYGPTELKKIGARKSVEVDWQTKSVIGTYAHIGIRVGTTDGMPKDEIHWGGWVNV